jgi:hypothetical protein
MMPSKEAGAPKASRSIRVTRLLAGFRQLSHVSAVMPFDYGSIGQGFSLSTWV